ncbi:UNVERIFIED_CONTAM: hypothetical protein FKN15_032470 [Acipenser sinensis]
MNELQDSLKSLEQSCRRFRQQQFTFISALERTREHAHERTKPVSTLAQQGVTSSQRAQRKLAAEQGSEPARSSRAGPLSNTTATQAGSGAVKGGCSPDNEAGPWDTTKPAWRPPGPINKH